MNIRNVKVEKVAKFLNEIHIPEFDVFSIDKIYVKTVQMKWVEKNGFLHCELPGNLWPTMNIDEVKQAPFKFKIKANEAGFSEDLIKTFALKFEFKCEMLGVDMFYNEIFRAYHILKDQTFLDVLAELAEKYQNKISNPQVVPHTKAKLFMNDFSQKPQVESKEEEEKEYVVVAPGGPGFASSISQ